MCNRPLSVFVAAGLLTVGSGTVLAQDSVGELLQSAMSHLRNGDAGSAARITTQILEQPGPRDSTALWIRGNAYDRLEKYSMAVRDLSELAEAEPREPGILIALGGARFKAGDIEGSINAFDAAARIDESLSPQLWQRGISHYYAGRLDDCIAQFEAHRTVNPQDVENSVWHFLCHAARNGFPAARQALIPVDRDGRVPMAEVFALFAGSGSDAEVMRAAESNGGDAAIFYAHLYLGLFYEASGSPELSSEHIEKATSPKMPANYMWQVARVHRELRSRQASPGE